MKLDFNIWENINPKQLYLLILLSVIIVIVTAYPISRSKNIGRIVGSSGNSNTAIFQTPVLIRI